MRRDWIDWKIKGLHQAIEEITEIATGFGLRFLSNAL